MNITAPCVYCKKNNSYTTCTRCWKTNSKECPYFNQKTNADYIRSMSDEELAKYLFEIGYDEGWPAAKDALEWLQQPMKVSE